MAQNSSTSKSRRRYFPKTLLTPSELRFRQQLCDAFPDLVVLSQVSMGALVDPPSHYYGETRERARRPYQAKIVDFVLWNPRTNEVACLVELDDASHDDRKEQDDARDAIVGQAGYRLLRVDVRALPPTAQLREQVLQARVPDLPLPEPKRRAAEAEEQPAADSGRSTGAGLKPVWLLLGVAVVLFALTKLLR